MPEPAPLSLQARTSRSWFFPVSFLVVLVAYIETFAGVANLYTKPPPAPPPANATLIAEAGDIKLAPLTSFAATTIAAGKAITPNETSAFPAFHSTGDSLNVAIRTDAAKVEALDPKKVTLCRHGSPARLKNQRASFVSCPPEQPSYCLVVVAISPKDLETLKPATSPGGDLELCSG